MSDDYVKADLFSIATTEKELLKLYMAQLEGGFAVKMQHFYLFGIARRTLSLSKAFRRAIEECDSIVALSLLRLHLDTMLRLYALFFVSDPNEFAGRVFHGTAVNKLKDAKGKLMRDAYLAQRVATLNPWVTSVYESTSGFVHFSHRHIFAAIGIKDDAGEGEFELQIGPTDVGRALGDYREPAAAFLHVSRMICVAVADWFSRGDGEPGSGDEIGRLRQEGGILDRNLRLKT